MLLTSGCEDEKPTAPGLDGALSIGDGGGNSVWDGTSGPLDDGGAGGGADGSSRADGGAGADASGGATPWNDACKSSFVAADATGICASCVCGRCRTEASACENDRDCIAAFVCMSTNACVGMACYCGTDSLGCAAGAKGACKDVLEAAAGQKGEQAVSKALGEASSPLGRAAALRACAMDGVTPKCSSACQADGVTCGFNELACQQRYCTEDLALAAERARSEQLADVPHIRAVSVNGVPAWAEGSTSPLAIAAGDTLVVEGRGFGGGTHVDFSKLLIGQVRALETDLTMYEQQLDISRQVHSETPTVRSAWQKDIQSWTDDRIVFTVPRHASRGPLTIQVQKREPGNESYIFPGERHAVLDTLTMRIVDPSFQHRCDVVSGVGQPRISNEVPLAVDNANLATLVTKGREIFWSYDYNIGLTHNLRGLDWTRIMRGEATDPVRGGVASPLTLFGAYPTVDGEVPTEATADVVFDPYPQKNPIPGWLLVVSSQKFSGKTRNSGYVGYRYAESVNPYTGDGEFIGFNCASCHGYKATWEAAPGQQKTRIVPGLPNPRWSMKWAVLGTFKGVVGNEKGPIWDPGEKRVDKTALIYAMPHGHGEHDLIRIHGEGSLTDNDYGFAPIAIPNVTYYLPIRRSLSHTESYVGFEGSYIHAEEPDGALGSMDAASLQALTAYMGTLDNQDDELRRVGLYRELKSQGLLALAGDAAEGAFVQSGAAAYPAVTERLERGKATFARECASCHEDHVGQYTTERMVPLHEVGRFFEPTVYHREMQSIRTNYLRDLYFTQHRGLLSDGHVRNLADLVDPDRCREGSALYNRYYTLHEPVPMDSPGPDFPALIPEENPRGDVFRVLRGTDDSQVSLERNAFVERFRYFVRVPWDDGHYYWDYQKLRREYGPWEIGSAAPIGLPAAPHPWCARSAAEVSDLVLYLSAL